MHAIRLRHPWKQEWHPQAPPAVAAATPPSGHAQPLALYQRSFNRPSGLLPEQAVWLVVEPWQSRQPSANDAPRGCHLVAIASLKLNAVQRELVAADGLLRAQIATDLQPFNRLEILCELSDQTGVPPELAELMEVRLEIDST